MLLFNEGTLGDPDRNGPIGGTLSGYDVTIPVVESTYAVGRYLVDNPTATVHLAAFGQIEVFDTLQRDRRVEERSE